VLFCVIVFTSGFLLGTFCKAQAAELFKNQKATAYIEDQIIKDKMDQIKKSGQADSTGASDSDKNSGKDSGELSDTVSEDTEEWQLILVNPWNKLPDDYVVTLKQLKNGQTVDEHCYPDLQQMIDDCRAAGLSPVICSSYRSMEKQVRLFNNKVTYYMNLGYSLEKAKTEAAKSIAVPGTSEHQLGLAVDIVDINNQKLDSSQENTPVQQWLMENSWKYGFILRYPSDKSEITGISYEPWHYRYVGKEAAEEIYTQEICLEEYLDR
jgi:D-alanyl-D-alanine carboxypeptidase